MLGGNRCDGFDKLGSRHKFNLPTGQTRQPDDRPPIGCDVAVTKIGAMEGGVASHLYHMVQVERGNREPLPRFQVPLNIGEHTTSGGGIYHNLFPVRINTVGGPIKHTTKSRNLRFHDETNRIAPLRRPPLKSDFIMKKMGIHQT